MKNIKINLKMKNTKQFGDEQQVQLEESKDFIVEPSHVEI